MLVSGNPCTQEAGKFLGVEPASQPEADHCSNQEAEEGCSRFSNIDPPRSPPATLVAHVTASVRLAFACVVQATSILAQVHEDLADIVSDIIARYDTTLCDEIAGAGRCSGHIAAKGRTNIPHGLSRVVCVL